MPRMLSRQHVHGVGRELWGEDELPAVRHARHAHQHQRLRRGLHVRRPLLRRARLVLCQGSQDFRRRERFVQQKFMSYVFLPQKMFF